MHAEKKIDNEVPQKLRGITNDRLFAKKLKVYLLDYGKDLKHILNYVF